jgi:pyruvate kinase
VIERPADIIVTLNIARVSIDSLRRYVADGATCLRLNGAFLAPAALVKAIEHVREGSAGRARLILDLPGFKIRFLHLEQPLRFVRGRPFCIKRAWLNYQEAFDLFREGSLLRINDGRIELSVVAVDGDEATCVASRSGTLTPGKGLHMERASYRPFPTPLSTRDRELVKIAIELRVDCLGLSFVNSAEDVLELRDLCHGSGTTVVPKIESKESVKRIGEIVELADEVIIDRGDLAGEIGLGKVWRAQREVIAACKRTGTRVYAATQVLSSMVQYPLPSIAEIDSLHGLIHEGIDGVQLSEETSVGRYPREAIQLVRRTFDEYERAAGSLRVVAASA